MLLVHYFVNFGKSTPPLTGGDEMIIDAPAVDWLTFTTYENDHYLGWKDWQRKLTGEQKQAKFACMTGNG